MLFVADEAVQDLAGKLHKKKQSGIRSALFTYSAIQASTLLAFCSTHALAAASGVSPSWI